MVPCGVFVPKAGTAEKNATPALARRERRLRGAVRSQGAKIGRPGPAAQHTGIEVVFARLRDVYRFRPGRTGVRFGVRLRASDRSDQQATAMGWLC